jgi:integrase
MLWCFAYYLGIRKGELLKFRWDWVLPYWTETEPIIKVPGEYCKSGEPHTIPLYHPEMRGFVEMAMTERNPLCPYMFQYRGRRLKSPRTAFEAARLAVGLPGLIFHDTRRTAIREMELARIPRRRAMQITGHRTESVYKRYDIGDESEATEAGKDMRAYWAKRGDEEAATQSGGQKLGERPLAEESSSVQSAIHKLLN